MYKDFFRLYYNDKKTVIILFLFLFQMLGLRLFSGFGFILSLLIFILLVQRIKISKKNQFTILFFSFCAFFFQLLKGSSIIYCILVAIYVANSILLIHYSKTYEIRNNFKAALKIYIIQAFISVLVYLLVPKNLFIDVNWSEVILQDKSFLGLFYYVTKEERLLPFLPIPRISGWAWEPGCLQLLVNLYICLEIYDKTNFKKLILPSVVLVLTGSTSGYLIWSINLLLYALLSNVRRVISLMPVFLIIAVVIFPIMMNNIVTKLSIGTDTINTSGAIRMRDFFTGVETIKKYPFWGIDTSDLANSKQYQQLEDAGLNHINSIASTWHDYFDYAAGGYCNGIFAMHMLWGIFGLLLFYCFFKCQLWKSWSYGRFWYSFPIIFSLSLISEPISNTSFFLFFCLYNILTKTNKHAYINYNSYLECS